MLGRLALLIFMLVGFIVAAAILTAGTAALLKAVGLRGEPFLLGVVAGMLVSMVWRKLKL
jgi:hypothetical protein